MTPATKKNLLRTTLVVSELFDFIDWAVDITAAFIHFLTDSMIETFMADVRIFDQASGKDQVLGLRGGKPEVPRDHICCTKSFISDDERRKFNEEMTKLIEEEDGSDSIYLNAAVD